MTSSRTGAGRVDAASRADAALPRMTSENIISTPSFEMAPAPSIPKVSPMISSVSSERSPPSLSIFVTSEHRADAAKTAPVPAIFSKMSVYRGR